MVVCDGSLLKRKRKMSCLDIEKKKRRKKKKSKVVGLRKIFVKKNKKENYRGIGTTRRQTDDMQSSDGAFLDQ